MIFTAIEKVQRKSHSINLVDRKELKACGVKRIDYFSEEAVVVLTEYGSLSVKGRGLFVDSLNSETGELLIRGEINSAEYFQKDEGRMWLKRIFR